MTRALAAVALAALLAGCGKYGPPVRTSALPRAGVSDVTAGHPADCQDPAHGHGADAAGDARDDDEAAPAEAAP